MKSSELEILLKRIEIRCAMWAMGLIDEELLDLKLSRINAFADILEDQKSGDIGLFFIDIKNTPAYLKTIASHNKHLLKEYFR